MSQSNQNRAPAISERVRGPWLAEARLIAENNGNYSLYRLKKDDQKKICAHYGISQLGTKQVLEKRIVEHRDSIYVYREPGRIELNNILRRFNFCGTIHSHRSCPDATRIKTDFKWRSYLHSKLVLAVFCSKLETVVKHHQIATSVTYWPNNPVTQISVLYQEDKEILLNKINRYLNELQNQQAQYSQPPVDNRPNIQMKNETEQIVYIYFGYKRPDGNDNYIECKYLLTINPGATKGILYSDNRTIFYASKTRLNDRCYYIDIKDYIVSEKKVTDTEPGTNICLIKMNRQILDQWKEAALKCDFLLKELKRLGVEKDENFASIIDMHQDIIIPKHSERDKEVSGIPSRLTNIT
tara:strand:- start:760 stop:1821 length:1062 start_codon:yes stop_codon:yes gene_type:complete